MVDCPLLIHTEIARTLGNIPEDYWAVEVNTSEFLQSGGSAEV
jgi:hypothetical protein